MKKIFLPLVLLLSAVSCAKTETDVPVSDGARVYTFVGTPLDTKLTVGELSDGKYPGLWSEGDALDILDATSGDVLGTATLTSGAGQNTGCFSFSGTLTDGTSVRLVYPSGTAMKIAAEQTGENKVTAAAWSDPVAVSSTEPVAFTLSHNPALVRIELASSAFSSMNLESVTLWSEDAAVSGTYTTDAVTGEITPQETEGYVRAVPAEATPLSGTRVLWLSALPSAEAVDFVLIVKLKDADKTVTIPVEYKAKKLQAGKVASIKLTDLSLQSNSFPWYEPTERRYIPDGVYAYGTQNTYRFNPPASGVVYTTFDCKARGDFMKVRKPAFAKVTRKFDLNKDHNWTYVGTSGQAKNDDFVAVTEDYMLPLAYRVGNDTYKKGGMGQVGLYDEDQRQIWAFNIWYTEAPAEIQYASGKVQALNLGAANYGDNWKSQGLYFQWGRPFPIAWSAGANGTALQNYEAGAELEQSAANSTSLMISPAGFSGDWTKTHRDDLWGCPSTSSAESGIKSVMDPCPEGYRVASRAILEEVLAGTPITSGRSVNALQPKDISDFWLAGSLYYGTSGTRAGGNAFFAYWANCPVNQTDKSRAFCIFMDKAAASANPDNGCARSNAQSVRCMKDTDNR